MKAQAAAAPEQQRDPTSALHQSFLFWNDFYWAKIATILSLLSLVGYVWHQPIAGASGGTWLGYTLGTIGALIILWLTWFGYRKRAYDGPSRVQAFLSAHVYLGLSLIIVATLHTGFHFGWDVHTLTYGLMLLVIVSGLFGIYAYSRYPKLMTENRRGNTMAQMMRRLATLDSETRQVAIRLTDQIATIIAEANQNTRIGGTMLRQLSGRDPKCSTAAAKKALDPMVRQLDPRYEADARTLMVLVQQKEDLLGRLRRDIQFKALLDIWLYIHVPITFALIAALLAHVIAVFFYF